MFRFAFSIWSTTDSFPFTSTIMTRTAFIVGLVGESGFRLEILLSALVVTDSSVVENDSVILFVLSLVLLDGSVVVVAAAAAAAVVAGDAVQTDGLLVRLERVKRVVVFLVVVGRVVVELLL